jgi:hypothetical protein
MANKGLIYDDLTYLLDEAIKEFENFKKDMEHLFGSHVKTDVKVKKTNSDYNIVGIRRVLVKWVENLIESNANIVSTRAFHNFIRNKTLAYNHFYIRSGEESEPIH